MSEADTNRIGRLILVPALITLAVTLLRLIGERLHWSRALFNPEAGGGGALVGISWLPPFFGLYFAWRLARAGQGPGPLGRAYALAVVALLLLPASGLVATSLGAPAFSLTLLSVYAVVAIVGVVLAMRAWPQLGRVLLAYAFAARIPVLLVMLVAMLGNWGTHYDVPPEPDFPAMSVWAKWFWIGVVPQMTVWIWWTVVAGALFGIGMGAFAARRRRAAAAV
jgi:hypothetical protein